MTDMCACGHVLDEHDDQGECMVVAIEDDRGDGDQSCPCFAFEAAP